MKHEEFTVKISNHDEQSWQKLAKQYVKEAGEKYLLENDGLAQSPTPALDAKITAARRRQKWQRHRLTFMGVAASVIVIIIAGIAFLPEVLREYAPTADMLQPSAPMAAGGIPATAQPAPMPAAPAIPPPAAAPAPPPAAEPRAEAAAPPATDEAVARQYIQANLEAAVDEAVVPEETPATEEIFDTDDTPAPEETFAPDEPPTRNEDALGQHIQDYLYVRGGTVADAAPAMPPGPPGVHADAAGEPEYGIEYDRRAVMSIRQLTDFSHHLFEQVLATGDENAVISPLSAYYVLAMAAQGAAGQTLEEFDQLLRFPSRYLPWEMQTIARELTRTRGDTILNIAGSVWIHDRVNVNTAFNQTMNTYFGAPANSRDFFAPETVPEINRWVYDNTQGLIDSILDEFSPDDVMLLINALYFKGQWPRPMHYVPGTFTTAAGQNIDMDFLSTGSRSQFHVTVNPRFEAALLPYNCGRFGFMLMRPTDGTDIREFAAQFRFVDHMYHMEYRNAIIKMPGLDFEYEIKLNDILQNMGLVSAFDFATADFSELIYTNDPIRISEVLQKVRIIVDRYGTEAAAVTAILFDAESIISPPPIELIFNTPYIYAIICTLSGIPLFMGIVDNP